MKKTEFYNSKNNSFNTLTKCTNIIKTSKTIKRKCPSPFIPIWSMNTNSKSNKISGESHNKNKWRKSETSNSCNKISGLWIKLKHKRKKDNQKCIKLMFNKIREFMTTSRK
jgi:hypothetical protein